MCRIQKKAARRNGIPIKIAVLVIACLLVGTYKRKASGRFVRSPCGRPMSITKGTYGPPRVLPLAVRCARQICPAVKFPAPEGVSVPVHVRAGNGWKSKGAAAALEPQGEGNTEIEEGKWPHCERSAPCTGRTIKKRRDHRPRGTCFFLVHS